MFFTVFGEHLLSQPVHFWACAMGLINLSTACLGILGVKREFLVVKGLTECSAMSCTHMKSYGCKLSHMTYVESHSVMSRRYLMTKGISLVD